jgi:hypothetical protein
MKKLRAVMVLPLLVAFTFYAGAQDKPKIADSVKIVVPLKVTVVFNEYEGEKKLSSLPYTLFLKMDEHKQYLGSLRMGVRVPISIGGKDAQIQYQDVGSNIDCTGQLAEDGRYVLDLTVERSSIYPTSAVKNEQLADQRPEEQPHGNQPLLRTFRAVFALMLRDGQTTQSTMATDPLNGRVMRVDVTLNVLK